MRFHETLAASILLLYPASECIGAPSVKLLDAAEAYGTSIASVDTCEQLLSSAPSHSDLSEADRRKVLALGFREQDIVAMQLAFYLSHRAELQRARSVSPAQTLGFCRQIINQASHARFVFRERFLQAIEELNR